MMILKLFVILFELMMSGHQQYSITLNFGNFSVFIIVLALIFENVLHQEPCCICFMIVVLAQLYQELHIIYDLPSKVIHKPYFTLFIQLPGYKHVVTLNRNTISVGFNFKNIQGMKNRYHF